MAEPIKYRPVAETRESARDQLDELLQVLADSGALRVLKDAVERIGQVTDVLAARFETEPGRNALGNLSLFGTALTQLPPGDLQVVLGAAVRAFERAGQVARRDPPGLLHLMFVLRREGVRRSLFALLALLDTMGQLMAPEKRQETAMVRN